MNKDLKKVIDFYEKSTEVYFNLTGGYIHGYASPEGFNLGKHLADKLIHKNDHVLDAGCGTCKLAIDIAQCSSETTIQGITISPAQVIVAKRLIQEANLSDRIQVQVGDFHQLKELFKNQMFNVIIFNESLFHSKRPGFVIRQAFSILKPGGLFYAKSIYRNIATKNVLFNLKMKRVIKKIQSTYHYYPQYKKRIQEYAIKSGFEIVSFDLPPYPSDFNKLIEFEKKYGFSTYRYIAKTNSTHWRELICRKPE